MRIVLRSSSGVGTIGPQRQYFEIILLEGLTEARMAPDGRVEALRRLPSGGAVIWAAFGLSWPILAL